MRWLFFLFLIFPLLFKAEIIDSTKSKIIAELFYKKQYYKFNKEIIDCKVKNVTIYNFENKPAFFINHMSPSGFVIVSSNDLAFPVFGYSFENDFPTDNLPENLKEYLNLAAKQILNITNNNTSLNYKQVWDNIENTSISKINFSNLNVAPLINLKWDQGVPYNNYCPPHPRGPGGRCVTGCVATAMAMVMKYHNYPIHGNDFKTFYWYDWDTIDFENTYYRWNQMTIYATNQSADAIAELMYHCGISVNMNYGPDGSSSYTFLVPYAMKHYFRYHPQIRYLSRNNFFDYEWDMLIRDELTLKRPVIYSGSGTGGHAFVCDGFQDTCFYHFNWGWSGYANGYYYYNDLTPGNNDFSYGQAAVVYIMPYFNNYCVENFEYTDTARAINDGSGLSYYWNNTSCSWIIKPRNGKNIWLYFNSFNTEPNNDILYIYDGNNEQAPLLGAFSGYTLPPVINSTGNSLYLKFVTNDTIQGLGWDAYYSTTPLSIEENNDIPINIYPNPANEILFINLSRPPDKVELLDLLGKRILSFDKINSITISINTSNIKNGMYYLKITYNDKIISKKFSIIH